MRLKPRSASSVRGQRSRQSGPEILGHGFIFLRWGDFVGDEVRSITRGCGAIIECARRRRSVACPRCREPHAALLVSCSGSPLGLAADSARVVFWRRDSVGPISPFASRLRKSAEAARQVPSVAVDD